MVVVVNIIVIPCCVEQDAQERMLTLGAPTTSLASWPLENFPFSLSLCLFFLFTICETVKT